MSIVMITYDTQNDVSISSMLGEPLRDLRVLESIDKWIYIMNSHRKVTITYYREDQE